MLLLRVVPPTPPYPPVEPERTAVAFPDPRRLGRREVAAIGEDFRPFTILHAYRSGVFPWPHTSPTGDPMVLWFSPNPRAIFPLEEAPRWSRSLRRTLRHHPYLVTLDEAFRETITACGETRAETGTWITPALLEGYVRLHELGWAHSVEVWDTRSGPRRLVGGIYGVAIGGAFAGESMFHRETDCSKLAFASLVGMLRAGGFTLFDVQVMNPHLASLGCEEIPRDTYLDRLTVARERSARLAAP